MEIFINRIYFFIYSKDKRKGTLCISQNCKSYFSQGKEKKDRLCSTVKAKTSGRTDPERRDSVEYRVRTALPESNP